jgi:phosphatidylserine/phosphatidylglycerophosphate/cardiolipin synthase-like enzyme
MPNTVGKIKFYMGPQTVGGPDNLAEAITGFIGKAKKSLDIAVQELDSEEIAKAIINTRPGVRVRIVTEADYLKAPKFRDNPWTKGGKHEPNREIQNALLRSAAWVRSDFNPSIFHQKFIIRDNRVLLTGSTNLTDTGTTNNLNHVIIIEDKDVAKIYSKEFREIRHGHFGKLDEGHDPKPPQVTVSQIPIRILFAPDHSPEMDIMKQMLKAKSRIDFAIFTFAESSGIDDTMQVIARNGIKIKGILDRKVANQRWAANHNLVGKPNIELYRTKRKGKLGKLHHKLMVIDERVIIAGSFNYTGPANRLNDENVIMLGDLDPASPSAEAQKGLAHYAMTEIERIIDEYGVELQPTSS